MQNVDRANPAPVSELSSLTGTSRQCAECALLQEGLKRDDARTLECRYLPNDVSYLRMLGQSCHPRRVQKRRGDCRRREAGCSCCVAVMFVLGLWSC